jgi:hypothetical protein
MNGLLALPELLSTMLQGSASEGAAGLVRNPPLIIDQVELVRSLDA